MNPVELGAGGFCFLAAELLMEKYPMAALCRLTDSSRARFAHVFISANNMPADIRGFRSVAAMRFDYDDYSLIEEPTDQRIVRDFFYPKYSSAQMCAARVVLAGYIATHGDIFPTITPRENVISCDDLATNPKR